jgi:hypothetical protein
MNPLFVSIAVSALVFSGACVGLHLHRVLLSANSPARPER